MPSNEKRRENHRETNNNQISTPIRIWIKLNRNRNLFQKFIRFTSLFKSPYLSEEIMQMRILHTAAFLRPSLGMIKQMVWEKRAAEILGIDWKVRMFCPFDWMKKIDWNDLEAIEVTEKVKVLSKKDPISMSLAWGKLRREYHNWLKSLENTVDVFVLRYYVHDPFQLFFIKRCKKPVLLVCHTLETKELASLSRVVGKLRAWLELILGRHSIRNSFAVVGLTREIVEYEKKRAGQSKKAFLLYPNGIFNFRPVADKRGEIPELLFIASKFASWHGLDLVLSNIRGNSEKFILHLVGEVPYSYKELIGEDKRIRLHGIKGSEDIEKLAENCWLGLSSFALERKGMKQACTLKVREYLGMGIPVYAGHEDIFPENFPYYQQGDADMRKILKFARNMRVVSRWEIVDAAKPFIDKVSLLAKLYEDLNALFAST